MPRQLLLTALVSAATAALATLAVLRLASPTPAQFPELAVVAFATAEGCPDGWERYSEARGRVIIGAGHGDGLTERAFGSIGGAEKIVWEDLGLGRHTISQTIPSPSGGRMRVINPGGIPIAFRVLAAIGSPGANQQPVGEPATLPPYIALNYCRQSN